MTVHNTKCSVWFVAGAILTAVALTSCDTTGSSRSRTPRLPNARTVAQSVPARRRDLAQTLLNSPASRYMTAPALRALATLAGVTADNADQQALSDRGPTLAPNWSFTWRNAMGKLKRVSAASAVTFSTW